MTYAAQIIDGLASTTPHQVNLSPAFTIHAIPNTHFLFLCILVSKNLKFDPDSKRLFTEMQEMNAGTKHQSLIRTLIQRIHSTYNTTDLGIFPILYKAPPEGAPSITLGEKLGCLT